MDELRIGDRERDEAAHFLGEEYAAGRLTREEYDERTDAVWSARTRADLADLFTDLVQRPPFLQQAAPTEAGGWRPAGGPPPWADRARRGRGPVGPARVVQAARRMPTPLLVVLIVIAALVAMAVPFPIWVIGLVWLFVARGRHCGGRRLHRY